MDWISDNIEWVFSGIGVFILGLILKLLFRKQQKKKAKSIEMKQRSGSNSTNTQIGGDYNA